MIVLYPKHSQHSGQEFPSDVDVFYYTTAFDGLIYIDSKTSGLQDILALWVHDERDNCKFNWTGYYVSNINHFSTNVDCMYSSDNLTLLIKKLIQLEDILT